MTDLTNLPDTTTCEEFFFEILPEVLNEVDLPDSVGTEPLQINITGDDAVELIIAVDDDGQLGFEEGQADAPPIAITAKDSTFLALVCGSIRDQVKAATGQVMLGPRQLSKAFLPDPIVQKIKALSGDIQIQIVDPAEGEKYVLTITLGGRPPSIQSPSCTLTIDVPTLIDVASGKEKAQQLFFQGRIRVDGDMAVILGLMGAVTTPI
jgi:putative sterol carrier protein